MIGILGIIVLTAICYLLIKGAYAIAFGTREVHKDVDHKIPLISQCQIYRQRIEENIEEILNEPCEIVSVMSEDNLKLFARLYQWNKKEENNVVLIVFHGYRSTPVRDCAPIFKIAKSNGCCLFLVDQRTHGTSDGETVAMGIKERHDCLRWADYAVKHFGEDCRIMLAGYSMGASTVLMASGLPLPKQVKGIIADCGYSDVKEIVKMVGNRLRFPLGITVKGKYLYLFARLGAIIFGRFDPEEASPRQVLRNCKVPVLFIHGEKDRLVPVQMGYDNYDACASEKELFIVPEADHCMSYYIDTEHYVERVVSFLQKCTDI